MDILTWVIDNSGAMVAGATAILAGLGIIARLTKNPADDKIIAKLLEFFKLLPKPKK